MNTEEKAIMEVYVLWDLWNDGMIRKKTTLKKIGVILNEYLLTEGDAKPNDLSFSS